MIGRFVQGKGERGTVRFEEIQRYGYILAPGIGQYDLSDLAAAIRHLGKITGLDICGLPLQKKRRYSQPYK